MNRKKELSVIKLGGSLLQNEPQRRRVLKTLAANWKKGNKLVVVHGGGQKVDDLLARLNIEIKTYRGLRITDQPTLDVVISVLSGLVNKSLVVEFSRLGVAAAGFSGADGQTLVADFHPDLDGVQFGFVGRVRSVHPTLIQSVLQCGMLPVIAPVGPGAGGNLLNINADRAASALAVALGAEKLLFLTDVEGLLDDKGEVVPKLTALQARQFLNSRFVTGGMLPKLTACLEALERGVSKVVIAGPSRRSTLFSNNRRGTLLVAA